MHISRSCLDRIHILDPRQNQTYSLKPRKHKMYHITIISHYFTANRLDGININSSAYYSSWFQCRLEVSILPLLSWFQYLWFVLMISCILMFQKCFQPILSLIIYFCVSQSSFRIFSATRLCSRCIFQDNPLRNPSWRSPCILPF